jgi:hypothetical protein
MFRLTHSRLPVLALFGAAVLAASHAEASKGPRKSKVEGQITAVDTSGSVTFTTEKKTTVTLKVTTSTLIEVNNIDKATLAQLASALKAAQGAGNILWGDGYYDTSTMTAAKICADEQGSSSGGDS